VIRRKEGRKESINAKKKKKTQLLEIAWIWIRTLYRSAHNDQLSSFLRLAAWPLSCPLRLFSFAGAPDAKTRRPWPDLLHHIPAPDKAATSRLGSAKVKV
jgi:hypothetical protein